MYLQPYIITSVVFSLITFSLANNLKRSIKCKAFFDPDDQENLKVFHVIATSHEDAVHYFWSTFYLPSVAVVRTTKETTVSIDLNKLLLSQERAVLFSEEPLSSTGFTITQLWQELYASDSSDVSDVDSITSLNLEFFKWLNVSNSSMYCSDEFARISLVSSAMEEEIFSNGGSFNIEFSVAGVEKSASEYPHLIYTGNSTQIKVAFSNLYSNSSRVRYGMEMSIISPISENCSNESCKLIDTPSVSDEFSPGIFSDVSLLPPCSRDSFLSWRPVAYVSKSPSVSNSTDAQMMSSCSHSEIQKVQSFAEFLFRGGNYSVSAFNMTFGTKGDGFYPKTKYTTWSLMVGVGHSVGFSVSVTAILLVSIGMGALGLFMAAGLIFMVVQKCRKTPEDRKSLLSTNSINS